MLVVLCLSLLTAGPLSASEGKRLPAPPSARQSAEGYGPELAVDDNEATLWVASLKPVTENNRVWFQLDLGSVKAVARLHWLSVQGSELPRCLRG